jgi:hypothetical protein
MFLPRLGIHYVTTGGGVAPIHGVKTPPEEITQKVVSIENFVSVSVTGKTAHFQAIYINGKPLDEFEPKNPSGDTMVARAAEYFPNPPGQRGSINP